MPRVAWELYDPITDETYSMPVNPYADGGSNSITKPAAWAVQAGMYQDGSAVDHISTILFAQPKQFEPFSYTGRTYYEIEHTALEDWASRNYPIYLTDDLGRIWLIMIERFEPRRLPTTRAKPYKHEYMLSGYIIEQVEEATP